MAAGTGVDFSASWTSVSALYRAVSETQIAQFSFFLALLNNLFSLFRFTPVSVFFFSIFNQNLKCRSKVFGKYRFYKFSSLVLKKSIDSCELGIFYMQNVLRFLVTWVEPAMRFFRENSLVNLVGLYGGYAMDMDNEDKLFCFSDIDLIDFFKSLFSYIHFFNSNLVKRRGADRFNFFLYKRPAHYSKPISSLVLILRFLPVKHLDTLLLFISNPKLTASSVRKY